VELDANGEMLVGVVAAQLQLMEAQLQALQRAEAEFQASAEE
jgi:hypothetical protein